MGKVHLKIFFLFISFFCVCSCSKKEEKIPKNIISKQKMTEILIDIHLAEAQTQLASRTDNSKSVKQSYYKYIFQKHKISYDQLAKSYQFYAAHPDIFSKIYDDVITGL